VPAVAWDSENGAVLPESAHTDFGEEFAAREERSLPAKFGMLEIAEVA